MVPLTATLAMFPLQGKGRVAEQFSPPGQLALGREPKAISALLRSSRDPRLQKGSLFPPGQLYFLVICRHLVLGKVEGMVMQIIQKTELTRGENEVKGML